MKLIKTERKVRHEAGQSEYYDDLPECSECGARGPVVEIESNSCDEASCACKACLEAALELLKEA
jgi:hypothetical protein